MSAATKFECVVCGECEQCPECSLPMCTHDDGDCEYAAMVAHAIEHAEAEEPAVAIIREASPKASLADLTELDLDIIWVALRDYARKHRREDAEEAARADALSTKVFEAKKAVR